jgi:hypothetical protein
MKEGVADDGRLTEASARGSAVGGEPVSQKRHESSEVQPNTGCTHRHRSCSTPDPVFQHPTPCQIHTLLNRFPTPSTLRV